MSWQIALDNLKTLATNTKPRCIVCGMWFTGHVNAHNPRYCSTICSDAGHNEASKKSIHAKKLSTHKSNYIR